MTDKPLQERQRDSARRFNKAFAKTIAHKDAEIAALKEDISELIRTANAEAADALHLREALQEFDTERLGLTAKDAKIMALKEVIITLVQSTNTKAAATPYFREDLLASIDKALKDS